jgi:hypothetical protein
VDNPQENTMGLTCLWPWFDSMAGCMHLLCLMESERIMMLKNNNGGLEVKGAGQDRDNMIPSSYLFDQTSLPRGFDWLLLCFPRDYGCVWIDGKVG